ncbi:hypothetical protein HALDL1_00875 (plasmid) [Halobacterium sp. DL1]|jgi:predicted flap endonuclease-1-like 5' DNA nuclease|nr:hypothetical protein HALDL1_00875 [Halobacterium sp. DL1]
MKEYPSDQDYKSIVEEKYGRDKAQSFFRRHSHVLVHSGETEDLANLTRRIYLGYDRTTSLKEDVLEKDKRKKATAFIFETESEEEDLVQDLERTINTDYQYNENKELEVQSVASTDNGFDINLQYEDRSPSRRPLQNTQTRSITVSLTQTDDEEVWQGTQEYRYADEFNAASDFFDDWESKRLKERKPSIKRINFNLETIPAEDSVEMFNTFLQDAPSEWRFEQVRELGIKQKGETGGVLEKEEAEFEEEGEIEEELDEQLRGITDAVFKGSGLRENQFVQDCLDSGFYFNSVRALFDGLDSTDSIEVELQFKQNPKTTFDLSIVEEYERRDDGYEPGNLGPDKRENTRKEFRSSIVDLYGEYTDRESLIQNQYGDELTQFNGITENNVDQLHDLGIETPQDLYDADPETLVEEVDNIGETRAEDLTEESIEN